MVQKAFLLALLQPKGREAKIIDNTMTKTTFKVAYGDFPEKLLSFKNYIVL